MVKPLHVFLENSEELLPSKQYVTVNNYPLPIIVEKGVYIKRVSLTIDITGLGFSPEQGNDFEIWCVNNNIIQQLHMSVWKYGKELGKQPNMQEEAANWLKGLYGKRLV